jgi:uncharacterized ParB-like nuclease family protein
MSLNLDQIRIDGGTQSRATIHDTTVSEYADSLERGVELPPVTVFFDGVSYWLADGFHRYHAHRRNGVTDIKADVQNGTQADAKLYSYGANQAHGLRRTNADKRNAVVGMLTNFAEWADNRIAIHVGVSHVTVRATRKTLESTCQIDKSKSREGADGRTYKAHRNPKPAAEDQPAAEAVTPVAVPAEPEPIMNEPKLKPVKLPKPERKQGYVSMCTQHGLITASAGASTRNRVRDQILALNGWASMPDARLMTDDEHALLTAAVLTLVDRKEPLADRLAAHREEVKTLSETAVHKFERLVARQIALQREVFDDEVRKAANAAIPERIAVYKELSEKAEKKLNRYTLITRGIKGDISESDYRYLIQALHPDRAPDPVKLAKCYDIIRSLERYVREVSSCED